MLSMHLFGKLVGLLQFLLQKSLYDTRVLKL